MRDIITRIDVSENISLITLGGVPNKFGTLHSIFSKLNELNINVDMISQSFPIKEKVEVSFTIDDSQTADLIKFISGNKEFKASVLSGNCKITFFSREMNNIHGIAAYIFRGFSECKADIKMVTTSESEIACLVSPEDCRNVIKWFGEGKKETKLIKSFEIDHDILTKGFYLSDIHNNIKTFDIRMAVPNSGKYPSPAAFHTIEHLFACYARSSEFADKIIYVGPMGCLTGMYFLTEDMTGTEALDLFKRSCRYILEYDGAVLGAKSSKECGNYLLQDLEGAKKVAADMLDVLKDWNEDKMVYPK